MKNTDEEFYFDRKNYFQRFQQHENDRLSSTTSSETVHISKHIRHALDYFLGDLNRNREKTIERFLSEPDIEQIFLSLAHLLTCTDDR